MNRILKPCETVMIDGTEYKINTDFSVWIEVGELFLEATGLPGRKIAEILALVYPVLPKNPVKAMERIIWFYSGGEKNRNVSDVRSVQAPVVNLKRDFGYIWASFLGEFNIDISVQGLHWWKFCTLLEALGQDCCFSRIVSYRTIDTSALKNRKMKEFYEAMKHKYRLPDIRTAEEREMDTVLKLESIF